MFFRNSLVISNFSDISLGISSDFKYLNSFFSKLLINHKETLLNLESFKEKIIEKNPWENDNDIENDNPWEDKLNNSSSDLER